MAFRGRGGGFGGYQCHGKEEPFVLFPDINLPDATDVLSISDQKKNKEEMLLIKESLEWLNKTGYYLEQTDKDKQRKGNREIHSFSQYLVPSMFPGELTRGSNVRGLSRDSVEWDRKKKEEIDWNRIEKMEQDSDAKQKKKLEKDEEDVDKEDDDDDDDDEDDEDYEDPDLNDYIVDVKPDDDEDVYNDEEEGGDEPEL
ncbi:hypothetical protein RchiOBHm_Chr4g0422341 [Rosa chinensis]|uniref:DNA-directed RNA polymerase III, subunit Rpc31 n=1 Tax=Rosa chinensis TaxID=74649 RepID=A0A2P6QYD1_ROSCH|nr:phosphopantothenoylcysteine decarboxylase subunit SIS2 [Rosa chinensis]PRQ39190.1 hypothetical protein RchiOBHm_Chr4g0422341 [Rosa chinensis]